MVSRYVEGSVTLDEAGFKDLGAVARAGVAFKRLHDWPAAFETRFDLFAKIDEYLALVDKLGDGVGNLVRGVVVPGGQVLDVDQVEAVGLDYGQQLAGERSTGDDEGPPTGGHGGAGPVGHCLCR